MKKKCFLFLLFFCYTIYGFSQTSTMAKIVPPSPEAFSLSKVEFSDVNLYTGKVNYTIPLYTIKSGNFNYPINLSYTGGNGIKVGEIASSAGLGWNISYAGVVSRTIRGLSDDIYKSSYRGYIYLPVIPSAVLAGSREIYQKYADGIYDAEPDIYNLNAAGIAVSFYLGKDKQPVYIEKTDVKVKPIFTGYVITGFEATSVDGVRYIFDEVEESRTYANGGAPVVDNDYYITAWYLKRVISPFGQDLLTFYYTSKDSYFSSYDIITPYRYTAYNAGGGFNESATLSTIFYVHKPLLNKIAFASGEVLFTRNTTNRLDLNGDKALQKIVVKNTPGDTIKHVRLFHSYFGPSGGSEEEMRLRLDSLTEYSKTGRKLNYGFEYENTYSLPGRMPRGTSGPVYAEDHWGYYNGIQNTSFEAKHRARYYHAVPAPLAPIDTLIGEFGTANREPNALYAKSGMLKKVKLPTGGFAEFDYEGHSSNDERLPNTISTSAMPFTYDEQANNFTIATINEPFAYATVTGVYGAGFKAIFSIYASSNPGIPLFTDTTGATTTNFKYKLKPGSYFIRAKQTGFPIDTSALNILTLKKEVETLLPQKPVGGLRIKTSKLFDPLNNVTLKRDYFYTADGTRNAAIASTGTIANAPQYGFQEVSIFSSSYVPDYFSVGIFVPQGYIRQLQSTYPLNPTQGSDVGYAKTWTLDNDTLRTEYNFTSYNDFLELSDGYRTTPLSDDAKMTIVGKKYETHPIAPYDERDFLRGKPLSIIQYKKTGALFSKALKQENTYEFNFSLPTRNKAGGIVLHLPDTTEYLEGMLFEKFPVSSDPNQDYIGFKRYRIYTGRYDLKKTITTTYHTSDSTKSETTYKYGDSPWFVSSNFHYQPSELTNTTSDGLLAVNKLYYSYNGYLSLPWWDSNDLSTFSSLNTANRISDPVLTLNYRNSQLISGVKQRYGNFSTSAGSLLDISDFQKYNTKSLAFETEVQIINRSKYGSIVESKNKLSPSSTYLYSYNGQYPVAEISNASYAAVAGILTASTINSFFDSASPDKSSVDSFVLPLKSGLPNAQMSSYVYRPLIGMKSNTDIKGMSTYYEHDDFHRLAYIKNQDGDIVKSYCYTYWGQVTNCDFGTTVTYYNTVQSGNFTRTNCTDQKVGSTVTYTIAAGLYSSTVSQAAANALAQVALNAGGPSYANANGTCLYYNTAQSGNFIKNDCGEEITGSTVIYTIAAGSYSSSVSQADANAQAVAAVNAGGQTYANANGTCSSLYYNTAQSGYFTRTDCNTDGVGGTVLYTIAAGVYSSNVSQAAANALAQAAVNAGGPGYANANALCTYYNTAQTGNFTRDCDPGGVGGTLSYTIPAGSYSSTVSVAAANALAQAALATEGKAYANANALCTYYNTVQSRNYRRACPPDQMGSLVTYTVAAGTYSSNISVNDANDKAQTDIDNNGQAYANANGTCTTVYWNVQKSRVYDKKDCGEGYNGSPVTYTVPAGTYNSTISQLDADNKALTDISANGQNYANANGTCSASTITITYINQTKVSGGAPSASITLANFYKSGSLIYSFSTAQLEAGVSIIPDVYDVSFNVSGSLYDPTTQLGWGSIALAGSYVNYSDYPPSVYYLNGLNLNSNKVIYLQRLEVQ